MFLYYKQCTRGPSPAKSTFRPDTKSVNGQVAPLVGQPIELSAADFMLPLDVLSRMYPPPKSPSDNGEKYQLNCGAEP